MPVVLELRPVHGHHDVRARRYHIGNPLGEQRPYLYPLVRQQTVDLLDRMLGQQTARICQALADQVYCQRSTRNDPQGRIRQRVHALGVHIFGEQ